MINSVKPQSVLKRLETGKPGDLSYSGILIAFGWALPAYLLFYIPQTWEIPLPDLFWLRQFLILMMETLFFYTGMRYFVKKTLLSHRPLAFVAWILISCTLVLVTFYTFDRFSRFNEHFASYNNGRKPYQYIEVFLLTMTLLVAGLSISLSVYQEWQKVRRNVRCWLNNRCKQSFQLYVLSLTHISSLIAYIIFIHLVIKTQNIPAKHYTNSAV